MSVKTQFSVFLINKPGVLATVAGALAKAKVNIIALSLSDSGEHGVLRVVPEDVETTRKVLSSAHDRWTETEVLVVELENKPGAFANAARKIAEEHVNISYAYSTGGAPRGRSIAVFKVSDLRKSQKALGLTKEPHKETRQTVKRRRSRSRAP